MNVLENDTFCTTCQRSIVAGTCIGYSYAGDDEGDFKLWCSEKCSDVQQIKWLLLIVNNVKSTPTQREVSQENLQKVALRIKHGYR